MSNPQTTGLFTISRISLPTPFAVGNVNAYLLEHGGTRVLVDCGPKTSAAQAALTAGLRAHGIQFHDLDALVLTHGHVDHVGLTKSVRDAGVPVFSHPDVAPWLEPGGPVEAFQSKFFDALYSRMGVPLEVKRQALIELSSYKKLNDRSVVDVALVDGQSLPFWPDVQVIYVPGHAQAAVALYHPQEEWLIAGDQVLPHMSPNALIEPCTLAGNPANVPYTHSLCDLRASFKRLQSLAVQKVFPGHGKPFSEVDEWFEKRAAEQIHRSDKFLCLLREGEPATTFELAERYFPKHRNQVSLIMSETLGYLDWMEQEGRVLQTMDDDDIVRWYVAN